MIKTIGIQDQIIEVIIFDGIGPIVEEEVSVLMGLFVGITSGLVIKPTNVSLHVSERIPPTSRIILKILNQCRIPQTKTSRYGNGD